MKDFYTIVLIISNIVWFLPVLFNTGTKYFLPLYTLGITGSITFIQYHVYNSYKFEPVNILSAALVYYSLINKSKFKYSYLILILPVIYSFFSDASILLNFITVIYFVLIILELLEHLKEEFLETGKINMFILVLGTYFLTNVLKILIGTDPEDEYGPIYFFLTSTLLQNLFALYLVVFNYKKGLSFTIFEPYNFDKLRKEHLENIKKS